MNSKIVFIVFGIFAVSIAVPVIIYSDNIAFWIIKYKNGNTFTINDHNYKVANGGYIFDKDEGAILIGNKKLFKSLIFVQKLENNFFTYLTSKATKIGLVVPSYCEIYAVKPLLSKGNNSIYWKIDSNILLSYEGELTNVDINKICGIITQVVKV
jgi:hypothetical protein